MAGWSTEVRKLLELISSPVSMGCVVLEPSTMAEGPDDEDVLGGEDDVVYSILLTKVLAEGPIEVFTIPGIEEDAPEELDELEVPVLKSVGTAVIVTSLDLTLTGLPEGVLANGPLTDWSVEPSAKDTRLRFLSSDLSWVFCLFSSCDTMCFVSFSVVCSTLRFPDWVLESSDSMRLRQASLWARTRLPSRRAVQPTQPAV